MLTAALTWLLPRALESAPAPGHDLAGVASARMPTAVGRGLHPSRQPSATCHAQGLPSARGSGAGWFHPWTRSQQSGHVRCTRRGWRPDAAPTPTAHAAPGGTEWHRRCGHDALVGLRVLPWLTHPHAPAWHPQCVGGPLTAIAPAPQSDVCQSHRWRCHRRSRSRCQHPPLRWPSHERAAGKRCAGGCGCDWSRVGTCGKAQARLEPAANWHQSPSAACPSPAPTRSPRNPREDTITSAAGTHPGVRTSRRLRAACCRATN